MERQSLVYLPAFRDHRACADGLRVSTIAPNPSDFLNLLSSRPPVVRRLAVLSGQATCLAHFRQCPRVPGGEPPALPLIRSLFGAGRCGGIVQGWLLSRRRVGQII